METTNFAALEVRGRLRRVGHIFNREVQLFRAPDNKAPAPAKEIEISDKAFEDHPATDIVDALEPQNAATLLSQHPNNDSFLRRTLCFGSPSTIRVANARTIRTGRHRQGQAGGGAAALGSERAVYRRRTATTLAMSPQRLNELLIVLQSARKINSSLLPSRFKIDERGARPRARRPSLYRSII